MSAPKQPTTSGKGCITTVPIPVSTNFNPYLEVQPVNLHKPHMMQIAGRCELHGKSCRQTLHSTTKHEALYPSPNITTK
jgi:hypothetical protein